MVSLTEPPVVKTTPEQSERTEIPSRGVVVNGKGLRIASIKDEEWIEEAPLDDPEPFIAKVRALSPRADLFTFAEKAGTLRPRFPRYHLEWDNVAVVPVTTFKDWWENRVPQETRKNVRRSQRRGVTVQESVFDDALVAGIKRIYDEVPLRQGRRFWHYGKSLETIKLENSSYLERSDFIGAYLGDQLIGFIKVVYVGGVGRIMQILAMNQHFDKRPTNALLAKAVERCCEREMQFFAFGKYVYGKKRNSPVTEFKRRNGFEELRIPRYYVPLTSVGRVALALGLHSGVRNLLPETVTDFLLNLRAKIYAKSLPTSGHVPV